MINWIKIKLFFIFCIIFCFFLTKANSLYLDTTLKFIVAGHLYGEGDLHPEIYPQTTILANIDFFNSLNPNFFISLGDNVGNGNNIKHIEIFNRIFVSKLNIPFFTAYGNHDGSREVLKSRLNSLTYSSFISHNSIFIFLDTELNGFELDVDMLTFLRQNLNAAFKNNKVYNIFILTHKLIWATDKSKFNIVLNYSNQRSMKGYKKFAFFMKNINELLDKKPKNKNLYWISGDIGKFYSRSLFYHEDISSNTYYIASGVGDTNNDIILNFEVNGKNVAFNAILLVTNKIVNKNEYNLYSWIKYFNSFYHFKLRIIWLNRIKVLLVGLIFGISFGFYSFIFLI